MRIAILSIFPEMFDSFLHTSMIGRAIDEGLLDIRAVDIRPYSGKKHKNTDDYPFGGGAGMVMMAQPIVDAVRDLRAQGYTGPCIYLGPRGQPLGQQKVESLARVDDMILLCGHYEGVDQRALDMVVDEEISLGDFVLTGGELAALVVIDAVSRLIPGVLGSDESAGDESFTTGLLEYPQYTRPPVFMGREVPEVLLSGHHANVAKWRREQALLRTAKKRPDLLKTAELTKKDLKFLQEQGIEIEE